MSFTSTSSSLSVNGWKGGQLIFKDFVLADSSNVYANTTPSIPPRVSTISLDTGNVAFLGDQFNATTIGTGITVSNTFPSITNSNIESGTGIEVSVDGSGAYAISGSPSSVPIMFAPTANNWSVQQVISPNAPDYFSFGEIVTMNQNGDIVAIVGTQNITGTRKIELFTRSGSTWSYQDTITQPAGGSGMALSIGQMDFNTAGDILAVGDVQYAGTYTGEGAVYIFEESGGTWSLTHTLTQPNPVTRTNWQFGRKVTMNVTGDSIVSSDRRGFPTAQGHGVSRFQKQGASWAQTAEMSPTDTLTGGIAVDDFGESLDANKNDHNTIIVKGTVPTSNATYGRGRLYVFQNEGTSYIQTQEIYNVTYVTPPTGGFGFSVRMTADGSKFLCCDVTYAIYLYTT